MRWKFVPCYAGATEGTHDYQNRATTKVFTPTEQKCIAKWVRNCSSRCLNDFEFSVLVKGQNFAVPKPEVPVVDIITTTESVCRNLKPADAHDLQAKVVNLLEHVRSKPELNISQAECRALESLRNDDNICMFPADKGKCLVIFGKDEYHQECLDLLCDDKTYTKLGKRNPTSSFKSKTVELLTAIELEGGINLHLYRKLYPTTEAPPKFYSLTKIHKADCPRRPIVSSISSITYETAKHLASILSPWSVLLHIT